MPLSESYWPADTSDPLIDSTVGGALREAAAAVPDKVALVLGTEEPQTESAGPMRKY